MNQAAIFSSDIIDLPVQQLAQLPPQQLNAVIVRLDQLMDWGKQARLKLDEALDQRFGFQARAHLRATDRDFGTTQWSEAGLRIKFDLPKKVSWDQKQLADIAKRISVSGEDIGGYLDIKLSIPESRYNNWPPALQQQFAAARTVEPGKPSFTLALEEPNG